MQAISDKFQAIEKITLTTVPTEQAAFYLNLKPQTLRIWAMRECGLIRPIHIGKRLAWRVKDIKKVLGVEV